MLFPALLIFGPRHSPLAQVRRKPAPVTNLGSGSKQLPPVLPVTAKNALHEVSCVIGGEGQQALQTSDDVDLAGILGSVMAHEIGHMLLGSHAHAISGIMRGHWESSELHQIAMGTLLFLPLQEQRMRLRARSGERG